MRYLGLLSPTPRSSVGSCPPSGIAGQHTWLAHLRATPSKTPILRYPWMAILAMCFGLLGATPAQARRSHIIPLSCSESIQVSSSHPFGGQFGISDRADFTRSGRSAILSRGSVSVFRREFMPMLTVGFTRIDGGRGCTSQRILSGGNRLQVCRVNTRGFAAQMIQFGPSRDYAYHLFISRTMGEAQSALIPTASITPSCGFSWPDPAYGRIGKSLQAFYEGHGSEVHTVIYIDRIPLSKLKGVAYLVA